MRDRLNDAVRINAAGRSIQHQPQDGAGQDQIDGVHLAPVGGGEGPAQKQPAFPVGEVVGDQLQGGRAGNPGGLQDQDEGGGADEARHAGLEPFHGARVQPATLELEVELHDEQHDDKRGDHDGQGGGEGAAHPQQLAAGGVVQHVVAHIRGAVDAHRSRRHLRNGHNVGKGGLADPGMLHHHLVLDKGQHGVAPADGEGTNEEECPGQLAE